SPPEGGRTEARGVPRDARDRTRSVGRSRRGADRPLRGHPCIAASQQRDSCRCVSQAHSLVVCDGAGAPLRALLRGRRRRLRLMPERPDEPKPRPARRPSKEPAEQPATEPQPPAKGPTKKPRQRKKRLSTEKVEWMKGLQGEVLAVLLRGDVVGPHSVPTGV